MPNQTLLTVHSHKTTENRAKSRSFVILSKQYKHQRNITHKPVRLCKIPHFRCTLTSLQEAMHNNKFSGISQNTTKHSTKSRFRHSLKSHQKPMPNHTLLPVHSQNTTANRAKSRSFVILSQQYRQQRNITHKPVQIPPLSVHWQSITKSYAKLFSGPLSKRIKTQRKFTRFRYSVKSHQIHMTNHTLTVHSQNTTANRAKSQFRHSLKAVQTPT